MRGMVSFGRTTKYASHRRDACSTRRRKVRRIKDAILPNEPNSLSRTFRWNVSICRYLCRLQPRLQTGSFLKTNPFPCVCGIDNKRERTRRSASLQTANHGNANDMRYAETGVDRGGGFVRLAALSFSPFSWRSDSALLGGTTLLEGFHAHGD
jgi:hypothetical protein